MLEGIEIFGAKNFGNAKLGDKRRTSRLVKLVDQMCLRPGGSLPQKFRNPADLQAFYRLMKCDDVTHEAILLSHRQATMEKIAACDSPVLVIHDSTELDYTTHRSLDGLGQIGSGTRRGYIAQNSMAVNSKTREVLGLCNQVLHHRIHVSKAETRSQKRHRDSRESLLWLKGTKSLPNSWQLVDVCDRGADSFEFLESEINSGRRFVIRSSHDRNIFVGHGEPDAKDIRKLRSHFGGLGEAGRWTLQITHNVEVCRPQRKGEKKVVIRQAREAKLAVSFAPVQIKPSKKKAGIHENTPLQVWGVRVWEIDPPKGQMPLEWILLTNDPINSFAAAYRIVGWYENRWIIEEYHKGMKTGCKIEGPQFTTEDRLQPAIALISIVALTLIEMRDASRRADAKTRQARTIISLHYIETLSSWRHNKIKRDWTIHDFYYALARLGGHQNRKCDHPPGWQVLWEGWKELQAMAIGYEAAKLIKKCG
jgi:hypothetical protein